MFARLRSLLRLLFVWRISDVKQDEIGVNPPDCIIMLAFGQQYLFGSPPHLGPGRANQRISEVMRYADRGALLPVLAQWEYGLTSAVLRREYDIFRKLGSPDHYRNTREVLEEARSVMDEERWERAVIVAHPWHLARCIWTAQKVEIEVVHDQSLTCDLNRLHGAWNKGLNVPKDQRQTLSIWRWLPYEFMARGYSWIKGWI